MTSSGRNYDHDARFQRLDRDPMRTGYVLVSEERESGSEYSGSTCCCSSCASSCSSCSSSDEDDDAYLSDCSACWARRDALRRGRAGWREGGDEGSVGSDRRAEERDARRDYRHHHRHGRHGRGESRQQSNGISSRNNNNNTNGNYNTAATPAHRNLAERIVATTRRLHQEEENLRHFRSWIRVLEDVQRRSHVYQSNSSATPAAAAAAANQGSSWAAAVGRVRPRAGAGEAAPTGRTHVYSYPRTARGYFMSGGRSISSNRRRRL
ncbi:hypothetical protein V8C34DRAFT_301053 [Trichoderma compactum]